MKNFVYKSSVEWNDLIDQVLESSSQSANGVVIAGSVKNSDFCASIPFVKKKLKAILLERQSIGDMMEWGRENVSNQ